MLAALLVNQMRESCDLFRFLQGQDTSSPRIGWDSGRTLPPMLPADRPHLRRMRGFSARSPARIARCVIDQLRKVIGLLTTPRPRGTFNPPLPAGGCGSDDGGAAGGFDDRERRVMPPGRAARGTTTLRKNRARDTSSAQKDREEGGDVIPRNRSARAGGDVSGLLARSVLVYRGLPTPARASLDVRAPRDDPEASLRGAGGRLYESLRSFCEQEYPDYQIVVGVRSADDPAVSVVYRLMAEYPALDLRLVVSDRLAGANPKVSNLANLYEAAKYDILVVADSDIRVGHRLSPNGGGAARGSRGRAWCRACTGGSRTGACGRRSARCSSTSGSIPRRSSESVSKASRTHSVPRWCADARRWSDSVASARLPTTWPTITGWVSSSRATADVW